MKQACPRGAVFSLLITLFILFAAGEAQAVTRRVPADHPTIQQAINAAVDGDTILVSAGIYIENINFLGKAITVTSESGPSSTIIDGNNANTVVLFNSGEGEASVLSGFTVRNGRGGVVSGFFGGGIQINSASPTIVGNIITDNVGNFLGGGLLVGGGAAKIINNVISNNRASEGAGVGVGFSSAIIQGNTITNNGNTGTDGGGISIGGAGSTQVLDNIISNNTAFSGGGIDMFAAGTPTIRGNIIKGNLGFGRGGGISMVNFSDALIVQNLIVENRSFQGGGVYWLVPDGLRGPLLISNTIANNDSNMGSGIFADAFDARTELINNLIIGATGQTAVFCGNFNDLNSPKFEFNDVFSPQGLAYGGICPDMTGVDGNISADPLFINPLSGDYRLKPGSLSIDAGNNLAPSLPATDLDGHARILDGNRDGIAVVDIGAYEAFPPSPPFDLCLQDDSNGNILRINSTTGDYQFTNCSGVTLDGTGALIHRGGVVTLQHYAADRRVLARIDAGVNRGTAAIQVLSQVGTFTIIDRNTGNNTCACG